MSRIFWDTMLFIYFMEGEPAYLTRAQYLMQRMITRGDSIYTSNLALGEILAGAERSSNPDQPRIVRETLDAFGLVYLPFDEKAVLPFSRLRSQSRVKVADAIHLACAASAGIDLFLTNDQQLTKLNVPGIQFIADFNTPLL